MGFGIGEILLLVILVLILFGAGKLPKVMGDLAQGVKSFKRGMQDDATNDPKKIEQNADEK